ncbi:MAG: DNA repair protein RadA [Holosporaceae bacterium]|nr:DNA repair protein RadA [Holosporaceae bacterium]
MAKGEKGFYCSECGTRYPKWLGRCEDCGQWNSVVEDVPAREKHFSTGSGLDFQSLRASKEQLDRKLSGLEEFDRVLGGGLVAGSVVLIGGDPGIGKSTLLLQVSAALSQNSTCVYISGEESPDQICLRASRLEVDGTNVKLACGTNIDTVLSSLSVDVNFLIVDSIQTLQSFEVESVPGSVSQVRTCAYKLINFAKTTNTAVFLIGHVTKDGAIAGPRILEHMVDTVLYFEGEGGSCYRILRAIKNRYGPCDELGIFEMRQNGLAGVSNPSVLFLTQRNENVPGSVVFCGMEGSRPIMVEVQALASKSYFPSPRRTVIGWDLNRLFMVLAVMEARCKVTFSDRDVYLCIAGGLRIGEPACDLAVAMSLLSSRSGKTVSMGTCAFGEIGLTGEVRSVPRASDRIKEATKLGFKKIVLPSNCRADNRADIKVETVGTIMELAALFGI